MRTGRTEVRPYGPPLVWPAIVGAGFSPPNHRHGIRFSIHAMRVRSL
jgi:hypothetical protein